MRDPRRQGGGTDHYPLTTGHCLFVSDLWLDLLNGKNIDR